jgi:hypothetical protein
MLEHFDLGLPVADWFGRKLWSHLLAVVAEVIRGEPDVAAC